MKLLLVSLLLVSFGFSQTSKVSGEYLDSGNHDAELNGVKFWYSKVGHGPLLIVQAPGWGVGSEYLRNGLAPLADHFTLVFYDPRGSGRSSEPSDSKSTTTSKHDRRSWGFEELSRKGRHRVIRPK